MESRITRIEEETSGNLEFLCLKTKEIYNIKCLKSMNLKLYKLRAK
jgi:hypothetical protein